MRRAGPWLALVALAAVAAAVRWRIADLADWGIDEAANLWLATGIAEGAQPALGLVSSRGVPNLAGVPLLMAPLTRLPDLLAVSRGLGLLQLAALIAFAVVLARGRGRALAVAALAFCPAALLSGASAWNQYVALPINAGIAALLVRAAEQDDGARHPRELEAALLLAALLLLQPAVHLAGFGDAVVQGLLALVLLPTVTARDRGIGLELGIAIAGCAAFVLYGPWIVWMLAIGPNGALAVHIAALLALVIAAYAARGRLPALLRPLADAHWLAWGVPLVLIACTVTVALSFFGSQVAVRLLSTDRWGIALLVAQALLAALALPAIPPLVADCAAGRPVRAMLEARFGPRWRAAALLLANAGLLLLARAAIAPEAFTSSARPDLLVPLLPSLLAPLVLLAVASTEPTLRTWGRLVIAGAVAIVVAFGIAGPGERVSALPYFVPASEMRAAADWIASHGAADGEVDVAYHLGREDLMRIACSPLTPWYTSSRPYDWLLRRRHGLHDRREGSCGRGDGGRFLVAYRADAPPLGRVLRLSLPHLAIWE